MPVGLHITAENDHIITLVTLANVLIYCEFKDFSYNWLAQPGDHED